MIWPWVLDVNTCFWMFELSRSSSHVLSNVYNCLCVNKVHERYINWRRKEVKTARSLLKTFYKKSEPMWGHEQSRLPSHWQSPETTDGESVEEGPRRAPKVPAAITSWWPSNSKGRTDYPEPLIFIHWIGQFAGCRCPLFLSNLKQKICIFEC